MANALVVQVCMFAVFLFGIYLGITIGKYLAYKEMNSRLGE